MSNPEMSSWGVKASCKNIKDRIAPANGAVEK
jgi:hypothetical protein